MALEENQTRIAEFIGDSSSLYAYAFGAIARLSGLRLCFDWTAFMALFLTDTLCGFLTTTNPVTSKLCKRNMCETWVFSRRPSYTQFSNSCLQSHPMRLTAPTAEGRASSRFTTVTSIWPIK
jgi:hypothetical protein